MNMEEYLRALENHVASRKLNLGDGETVLSLFPSTSPWLWEHAF